MNSVSGGDRSAGPWTRGLYRRVHRHAVARLLHHRRGLAVCGLPTRLNPAPFIDFSVIGLVHAFLLFALIQTLALISGAHFNPAVTVAMTVLRQIKPPDALVYIVAQLAGAVAGALLTKVLLEDEGRAVHYGITAVSGALERGDSPRHGRRGDRHLLPGLGDRGRGGEPARHEGVGRARNRRHAGHARDGPCAAHGRRLQPGAQPSVRRSCPGSSTAPATSCSSTSWHPVIGGRPPSCRLPLPRHRAGDRRV